MGDEIIDIVGTVTGEHLKFVNQKVRMVPTGNQGPTIDYCNIEGMDIVESLRGHNIGPNCYGTPKHEQIPEEDERIDVVEELD